MANRSKPPRSDRETISAAIPVWKKTMVEAVRDMRQDPTTSATVEHALDELLRAYGFPVDAPFPRSPDAGAEEKVA